MAVGSMVCVQLGLALSVRLLDRLGPGGVVALRLGWGGVVLLVLVRPRPRDFTRRDLLACGVLGVVTAGLSLLFMLALARIPLATASARNLPALMNSIEDDIGSIIICTCPAMRSTKARAPPR